MKKYSFSEKLRYRFENTLSKGTIAVIAWLAVLSALIVIISSVIIYATRLADAPDQSMEESMWQSLMRTMDSGNVANDVNWPLRAVMLLVTLGGIFIVSTLIGTITSGMEAKMEEMRKGRSKVLEENHTLILGWSTKVFSIISELLIANENQKRPRIVIMADRDKVEMEDEIRSKFPDTKNTKIICRTGSPLDLNDLEVVSPHDARSIIILSPEEGENPDTHVIKSILALTNNPNRKSDKYHIVAEIRDEANMEAAHLVSNDEAVLVLAGDLIARVTAQTCRQSGLSVVYTELLDFDGAEIYFKNEPSLVGKTYKDALNAYEDSAVMGVFHANGDVSINPDMGKKLEKGDQVIAIAEDDDAIKLSGIKDLALTAAAINEGGRVPAKKERTLIMGWNNKGIIIIKELDNYVGEGSEVIVLAETEQAEAAVKKLAPSLKKQKLEFRGGSTTERATLDSLNIASFNHIIILCYSDMDMQEADAKTLITLLHLRNISEQVGHNFTIVSEMLDVRNRDLAEVTKADDFIVSDKLISLMLSQLSENKHLKKVFDDLFAAEGSEVYLKPAADYIKPGQPVNFYTVIESASRKKETAIGYRIQAQANEPSKAYGVRVNPNKSEKITFTENDKIVVLAED
jgi:voltage-gated potassium channel Kch